MASFHRSFAAAVLAACLAAPLTAQISQAERRGVRPGPAARRPLSTLVDVFLKNGEKVRGVVKQGVYVEVAVGVSFRPGKRKDPAAGIRLWHVAGAASYAFIPYLEVRSYRIVRTLSELEVREIASRAREQARERARQARARAQRKAAERQLEAGDRELLKKLEDLAGQESAEQDQRRLELDHINLLLKFPPAEGWLPTRIVEIRRRMSIDLFPSKQEKEFIAVFEPWKKAYLWWSKSGRERYGELTTARDELRLLEEQPAPGEKKGEQKKVDAGGQVSGAPGSTPGDAGSGAKKKAAAPKSRAAKPPDPARSGAPKPPQGKQAGG